MGKPVLPSPRRLAALAQMMADGRYGRFLGLFNSKARRELLRSAKAIEAHVPVLPLWQPTEKHKVAERQNKLV